MACLPPDRLAEKLGSAGLALEGGHFEIHDESGAVLQPGQRGQIVYRGPNVMMGYAESREDLSRGDDTGGELLTGDLGYLDSEGFLFITGRTKRIAKVAGARVSLDEVESMLTSLPAVAAVATPEDGIAVFTTTSDRAIVDAARRQLSHDLGAPFTLLRFVVVDELPLLSSGKVDYTRLTEAGGRKVTPELWRCWNESSSRSHRPRRRTCSCGGCGTLPEMHRDNCAPYSRILDSLRFSRAESLTDLPALPVSLFKSHYLASIPDRDVFKTMTSSGTTGRPFRRSCWIGRPPTSRARPFCPSWEGP